MKPKCIFLDSAEGTCTFRTRLFGCLSCGNYLKNDGNLADKMPYLSFVSTRRVSRNTFIISFIALFVSFSAMIIGVATFLSDR